MGSAKSVPVIGEAVTVVESAVKITVAGIAVPFDTEVAENLARGAGDAWVEYSEKNVIVGPINAGIRAIAGDGEGAKRVIKTTGSSALELAEGLPVVGHGIGIGYYIAGDKEGGHKCMWSASRTTAVIVAGAVTGGAGAGGVAAGMVGVGAGVYYDGVHSIASSLDEGKRETVGVWNIDREISKAEDANGIADSVLGAVATVAFDFMAAEHAGEMTKSAIEAKEISGQKSNVKAVLQSDELYNDVKKGAKTFNEHLQEGVIKKEGHVTTIVKDPVTGETSQGYSQRARADLNVKEFTEQPDGVQEPFRSRTQARRAAVNETSTLIENQPDAEPVLERNPATCAEHDAFDKAVAKNSQLTEPNNLTNAEVVSLQIKNGILRLVERCDNCKAFKMGKVLSDIGKGMVFPLENIKPYVCDACCKGMLALVEKYSKKHKDEKPQ